MVIQYICMGVLALKIKYTKAYDLACKSTFCHGKTGNSGRNGYKIVPQKRAKI